MGEHRVPMLGDALRRRVDPERSRDPQVRELVAALRTLDVPAPAPDFRAELRAQLVAVTPRLVAEGESAQPTDGRARTTTDHAPARSGADRSQAAPRRIRFAKPLIAAACVLTAFVLLLGGAVLLSRKALPGDALYGLKRASENTEYALASGAVDKGKLKLEFAGNRIGEVADLLPRASALAAGAGAIADSGQLNSTTAGLISDTLDSADADVRAAAQLLGGAAVHSDSVSPLSAVTDWAPEQITAMRAVVARIPAGSLRTRAASTLTLIRSADARAATLSRQLGCSCLDTTGTDQLGPIPCSAGCSTSTPPAGTPSSSTPPSAKPTRPGTRHTTPAGPGAPTGTAPAGTGPGGATTAPAPGGTTGVSPPGVSAPISTPTLPGLTSLPGLSGLPSVKLSVGISLPKLPGATGATSTAPLLTVSSSCASVSLGGIGVGVGSC